jgi:hypothetical protein
VRRGRGGVPPEEPQPVNGQIVDPDPLGVGEVADDTLANVAEEDRGPADRGEETLEQTEARIIAGIVGPEPAPREPVTHAPLEWHREFRKHTRTGQIWAIELCAGVLHAARELVRPEEMTHGALPVLTLYVGPEVQEYRDAAGWCETWEPKHTPESAIRRMVALEEELQDIDGKIDKLSSRKKKLTTDREAKMAELRRLIQQARSGQGNLLDVATVGQGPVAPSPEPPAESAQEEQAAQDGQQLLDDAVAVDPPPAETETRPASLPA